MDENQVMMMKMMSQPNTADNTSTLPSRALSIHKDSRLTLSKPKIRIIHVFTPEIIKTDTANFRELVQRLTGKPADHGYGHKSSSKPHKRKKGKVTAAREPEPRVVVPEKPKPRKAEQYFDVFRGLDSREKPAAKEELGGYLKDFADLDDSFMHELRGLQPALLSPHVDAAPQRIPYFDAATV